MHQVPSLIKKADKQLAVGGEMAIKFQARRRCARARYTIGCIGAGMIMAEVHLAAYKEAGFTVVAIASRTPANAKKVAERYGIPTVHATPEDADRRSAGRDPRSRLSARPAAGADPPRAEAEAHQGDPGAEAAVAHRRRGEQAPRRSARRPARSSRSTRTCASTSRCGC